MKFSVYCLLFGSGVFLFSCSQKEGEVHVYFTGDVMLDRGVAQKIDAYGAEYIFSEIGTSLNKSDYGFINLECPITHNEDPIEKAFNFRVKPESIGVLTSAGVTHASMANNHSNDQNVAGAMETYRVLMQAGIQPMGFASEDKRVCEPSILTKNGFSIAVFSALGMDLPDSQSQNLCACERDGLVENIADFKLHNPTHLVVCYLHWGIEYNDLPAPHQKHTARALIDAGADLIIGHHPHVVQTMEYYKGKPILYSLGNFVFDQHAPKTDKGIIVNLSVSASGIRVAIEPVKIDDCKPKHMSVAEMVDFKAHLLEISPGILLIDEKDSWLLVERPVKDRLVDFAPITIKDNHFEGTASLEKLKYGTGYRLRVKDEATGEYDDLQIKHPIYRFESADINGDGRTDLLLGIIKTTHFHPELEKRPQIYQIDAGRIRPLWLGSVLCQKLVDFKPIKQGEKNIVLTIEQDEKALFCNGFYHWQNFGLELIEYKNQGSDSLTALNYFNEKHF